MCPMRLSFCVLLLAAVGCVSSTPGVVRQSDDNPIVTIGAGQTGIGGGNGWRIWYVVDRATQTCWFQLGDGGSPLDCCGLRRVAEARPYITLSLIHISEPTRLLS